MNLPKNNNRPLVGIVEPPKERDWIFALEDEVEVFEKLGWKLDDKWWKDSLGEGPVMYKEVPVGS